MSFELTNKVVLITGAANGIGAQVVRHLLEENVKHVAILDVAEALGIALQNEMNSKHGAGKVAFFKCDITDEELLFSVFKTVTDEQGYIDVVINNAAIANDQYYKKEIEVNLTATVSATLKAYNLMRKDLGGKGGTVINVSSIAGFMRVEQVPVYCATKAAIIHFTTTIGMKQTYLRTDVRVMAIIFGGTESAIVINSFDEALSRPTYPCQRTESAARAVVEAYRRGDSGSLWLSANDQPAEDITSAYNKLNEEFLGIFD